ncbi:mitogen-activated protein kinase kinase kinase [Sarracenia purpurea var. burkii]
MNETLKQNLLLREQGDDSSFSYPSRDRNITSDHQKNVHQPDHYEISDRMSALYACPGEQMGPQKAISLTSSPYEFSSQTSERGRTSDCKASDETLSTWNKVLELPMFQNKPLLPFSEWNIDYGELTVGSRIGIGFFGEVFLGIWNGTDVAVKVFLEQDLTTKNMEDFCNEISVLRYPLLDRLIFSVSIT